MGELLHGELNKHLCFSTYHKFFQLIGRVHIKVNICKNDLSSTTINQAMRFKMFYLASRDSFFLEAKESYRITK